MILGLYVKGDVDVTLFYLFERIFKQGPEKPDAVKFDDVVQDVFIFGALPQSLAHVHQQVGAVRWDQLDQRKQTVLVLGQK